MHRFGDFKSKVEALDAVDGIKFYGKDANIDAALEEVNTFCFDRDNGWRGTEKYNQGVASQLVLITSSNSVFDGSIMEAIRQKVQRIQVVQIDEQLDNVDKIASTPLGAVNYAMLALLVRNYVLFEK